MDKLVVFQTVNKFLLKNLLFGCWSMEISNEPCTLTEITGCTIYYPIDLCYVLCMWEKYSVLPIAFDNLRYLSGEIMKDHKNLNVT